MGFSFSIVSIRKMLIERKANREMKLYLDKISARLKVSFRIHKTLRNELDQLEEWIGLGATYHLKEGVIDRLFLMPQMMAELLHHGARPSDKITQYLHEYLLKRENHPSNKEGKDPPSKDIPVFPKNLDEWFRYNIEVMMLILPYFNWYHAIKMKNHRVSVLLQKIETTVSPGFEKRLFTKNHHNNVIPIPPVNSIEEATHWLVVLFEVWDGRDVTLVKPVLKYLLEKGANINVLVQTHPRKYNYFYKEEEIPLVLTWNSLMDTVIENNNKIEPQVWFNYCTKDSGYYGDGEMEHKFKKLISFAKKDPGFNWSDFINTPEQGEKKLVHALLDFLKKHEENFDEIKAFLETIDLSLETKLVNLTHITQRL